MLRKDTGMNYLEMNHIKKAFGDLEVLKDISIKVPKGQVLAIIGPSGSGKSTLLRCATLLEKMDIVIASFHIPCICPGTKEQNTQALVQVLENPLVDIIGHPDDSRYPVDFETVVRAAKQNNKFLELNNTSLKPDGPRSGARENDLCMLKLCMEHGVMITLGSDAHVEEDICNFSYAEELLKEVHFPDQLIENLDLDRFTALL